MLCQKIEGADMGERALREEAENNFSLENYREDISCLGKTLEKAYVDGFRAGYTSGLEYAEGIFKENESI